MLTNFNDLCGLMIILLFFIAIWYLSLFSQTFFQHRYGAHGAFRMSRSWERFFYIFTYITQGSSYLSPRTYAILHRLHHAHTDTEQDPHSPSYSKNIFHMMWMTWKAYSGIHTRITEVESKYLKNLPDWPRFERWAHSSFSRLLWVGAYIAFFVAYANSFWWYLLLPVIIAMGPVHGAIINWFAHRNGYETFEMENTSKNLLPVDILMLGESYHNNHHKHPSSINFGHRWHELDPVYPVIRLLLWMKVIHKSAVPVKTGIEEIAPQKVESLVA